MSVPHALQPGSLSLPVRADIVCRSATSGSESSAGISFNMPEMSQGRTPCPSRAFPTRHLLRHLKAILIRTSRKYLCPHHSCSGGVDTLLRSYLRLDAIDQVGTMQGTDLVFAAPRWSRFDVMHLYLPHRPPPTRGTRTAANSRRQARHRGRGSMDSPTSWR